MRFVQRLLIVSWMAVTAVGLNGVAAPPTFAGSSFVNFESGQVRPLALSRDGLRLFALNTPDNRLEIFDVTSFGIRHAGSVPVGLEPVALAVRDTNEVWVVNHLSDSVSIVDVGSTPPRVIRTLLVGDEPRDIVFAGPGFQRAFITTAHRGQNSPVDPGLTTPGISRADVWVFDALRLGRSLGGDPLAILTLFGDTPRALAASRDGRIVYAAVFLSGNRTTIVHNTLIPEGGQAAGGLPDPVVNVEGIPQPKVGLVVKFDGREWIDELGRSFSHAVNFSLPDLDVFAIDAIADVPREIAAYSGVGTVLFNMTVNPVSGKVYVSNLDSRNEVRFSGFARFGGSTVRGRIAENRITVLSGSDVVPRHLNTHVDYSVTPGPAEEIERSLALPVDMTVTADGRQLYVAAFGSSKVGVFDTAALERGTFVPGTANQIRVSGGGPSGLVLDERNRRLYVLTRFDNAVSVVDTTVRREVAHVLLHNPEPPSVRDGRPFLYDAARTSGHGDAACASCHVFGDLDGLAWDLGDPDGLVVDNPNPFIVEPAPIFGTDKTFHPMKGPMTTQSLRGMANHGPMHWRGDRTGAFHAPSVPPDGGAFDEVAAFTQFNDTFVVTNGLDEPLSGAEMDAFTRFALHIAYPPNPIRALDGSLSQDQQAGRDFFLGDRPILAGEPCGACHVLDPSAGLFGTDGRSAADAFKIPHLRNLYQKIGMFGMPRSPFFIPGDNEFMGDQVRGFGFTHDGSTDTIFRHMSSIVFAQSELNPTGFVPGAEQRLIRQIEQYLLAFSSELAPIVGQQVTLTGANGASAEPRIDLLVARAMVRQPVRECDLVVKGVVEGRQRGWVLGDDGLFHGDRAGEPPITDAELRAKGRVEGQALTYTCVPPGSGIRIGVDRDEDGVLDGDEA